MKIVRPVLLVAMSCSFLISCATILAGRTQTISITSNPPGARCEFTREGRIVAVVEKTPGAVNIDKTKHDMQIACSKKGFVRSTAQAESGNEGYTLGNIILSGGVGWAIDSAVGADNKYPETIIVNLVAANTVAPARASVTTTR